MHHADGGRQRSFDLDRNRRYQQPVGNSPGVLFRGIYAIVDPAVHRDCERVLAGALSAGVRVFQYRAKAGVDRALLARMHARTQQSSALLIVNDDLDAARTADGLHAGQEDLELLGGALRAQVGAGVLGISSGVPHEAVEARALGADYVGVGPFNATASKGDAGPAIGYDGVQAVVRAVPGLPVVAIGGIGLEDLAAVKASGAAMAAVISALVRSDDPAACALELRERWDALP